MQCNYNSFIQIINFHGLFHNALRCRKTGACQILVPLRYLPLLHVSQPQPCLCYSLIHVARNNKWVLCCGERMKMKFVSVLITGGKTFENNDVPKFLVDFD